MLKQYFIRDNGRVIFIALDSAKDKKIYVYRYTDENPTVNIPVYESKYTILFIGKSLFNMTTINSGNVGEKFDGNTLLIRTDENKYTYIGGSIFSFTSRSTIIEYESPVGNNEYAYPFACDDECNYYLMNENVVVSVNDKHREAIKHGYSVYTHYYNIRKVLTHEMLIIPVDKTQKVGTQPIRYLSNPAFEYEWVVEDNTLYIREIETRETKKYTMEEYVEYIDILGIEKGLSELKHDKDYYARGYTGVIVHK